MGHDIDVKECPSPYNPETCRDGLCNHKIVDSAYISFNFSHFGEYYWSIHKLHGHTGRHGLKRLRAADKKLGDEKVKAEFKKDENGWTNTKNVFRVHVQRFIELCERHPKCRFYSDQVYDGPETDESDVEDSSEDGSDNGDEDSGEESDDGWYVSYRHPLKGNMRVDTFEKASEIYTRETLDGVSVERAQAWLDLAKKLRNK